MKDTYFETVMGVERLHRLFFDVIKAELDRQTVKDLSDIQCFILYNIGRSRMTVGEISNRGYYMGSNVTYNLKKMVENGYVIKSNLNMIDARATFICLIRGWRFSIALIIFLSNTASTLSTITSRKLNSKICAKLFKSLRLSGGLRQATALIFKDF